MYHKNSGAVPIQSFENTKFLDLVDRDFNFSFTSPPLPRPDILIYFGENSEKKDNLTVTQSSTDQSQRFLKLALLVG